MARPRLEGLEIGSLASKRLLVFSLFETGIHNNSVE
jgi:hypothetical protein